MPFFVLTILYHVKNTRSQKWLQYVATKLDFGQARCIQEYYNKLSEDLKLSNSCTLIEPLSLAWTVMTYPNLRDNPRRVQYWQGTYSRTISTTATYLRELVDECQGKIISQNQFIETTKENISFSVANPNLNTGITESYMLVPLTKEEAQQEFTQAQMNCQNYTLP